MRIENWSIIGIGDPYLAPELRRIRLMGNVYGHLRHYDGKLIITSTIVGELDGDVLTASGSRYVLGSINREYSALYPDAKDRLITSIRKRNGSAELS